MQDNQDHKLTFIANDFVQDVFTVHMYCGYFFSFVNVWLCDEMYLNKHEATVIVGKNTEKIQ